MALSIRAIRPYVGPLELWENAHQSAPMIRILLIDDNERVRRQLAARLQRHEDLSIVGEATAGEEALRQTVKLQPHVVLVETKTADGRGIETCRRIHQVLPEVAVLVLTSYVDDEERSGAFEAGAQGYLLKDLDFAALLQAVRRAVSLNAPGQTWGRGGHS